MDRIIGIDYGRKRVGLAVSDPLGIFASALDTIHSAKIIDYLKNYTEKENVVETNSRGKRKVRQEVKLDSYAAADEMVLASLVEPSLADLENKELQDSWGVLNPTDLLKAILSLPGEYSDLREEVQRICGFDIDAANALTEEAKKN